MSDQPLDPIDSAPLTPSGPSKLERAAGIAAKVLRHKQLLVAAMEMIRERGGLSEDEEVKIVAAYESGTVAARSALSDLVEKLQQAKLGKVAIALSENIQPEDLTAEGIRAKARPAIRAVREEVMAEARPFIEQAKQRLAELRALEEPTLQRLESISGGLQAAGREVALGLKGAGKEAVDELVHRGKKFWMSAETEELEREVFDWVLKALPRAERSFVRLLMGVGIVLVLSGLLVAAHQSALLQEVTLYATVALLIFCGFMLVYWGLRISSAMKDSRGQIERLANMTPQERRQFLTRRWTARAQTEDAESDPNEAPRTGFEGRLRAAAQATAAALAPARSLVATAWPPQPQAPQAPAASASPRAHDEVVTRPEAAPMTSTPAGNERRPAPAAVPAGATPPRPKATRTSADAKAGKKRPGRRPPK